LEPWIGGRRRGVFPDYFRQTGHEILVIQAKETPDEAGLKQAQFPAATSNESYTSPKKQDSVWKNPGPKAGPFQAKLSDGSIITCCWYRFIDQPALQDADLSRTERERLQTVVEQIHRHWTTDRDYLPSLDKGTLAILDSALIVKPPKGFEIGYVPIVTRQAAP
jgi:hypothetical protein